jgi:hypothetical protein
MLKAVYGFFFGPAPTSGRPMLSGGPVVRRFVLGYCILALGVVLGLYLTQRQTSELRAVTKQVAKVSEENRKAGCRAREGYERAALETQQFLAGGGHIPGVEDKLLRRGIVNNQRNASTLKGLRCTYKIQLDGSGPK